MTRHVATFRRGFDHEHHSWTIRVEPDEGIYPRRQCASCCGFYDHAGCGPVTCSERCYAVWRMERDG